MNETLLEPLVNAIDDMFANLIEKHSIEPLAFSAVVLARLILVNDFSGTREEFRELMNNLPDTQNMDDVLH
jgi:translation elongation factor EF-1beta